MFGIRWTIGSKTYTAWYHEDETSRVTANTFYLGLKEAPDVSDIQVYNPVQKEPKDPVYLTVEVEFVRGGRRYTYLTKNPVKPGSKVVVNTIEGLKVVTTVNAGTKTEKELVAVCPMSRYKHIVGVVSAQ